MSMKSPYVHDQPNDRPVGPANPRALTVQISDSHTKMIVSLTLKREAGTYLEEVPNLKEEAHKALDTLFERLYGKKQ